MALPFDLVAKADTKGSRTHSPDVCREALLHSNFNSRDVNARVVFVSYIFCHNFLGCGSYDLGNW